MGPQRLSREPIKLHNVLFALMWTFLKSEDIVYSKSQKE